MIVLHPLLKDYVVLQAEQPHSISGKTHPFKMVTLNIEEVTMNVHSDENGNFMFRVPKQPYNKTCYIQIVCDQDVVEVYVQYGDVFLFAGQSNIEYYMRDEAHFESEYESIAFDNAVYYATIPQIEYEQEDSNEALSSLSWRKLSKESLQDMSAIAYYATKEHTRIHPDRIIGVVSCSKGGTSASCWIGKELSQKNSRIYEEIIKPFEIATNGRTKEDFDEELQAYWNQSATYYKMREQMILQYPERTLGQIKQEIGDSPWPPPPNPYFFTRPNGLYKTMFKKITPYTFSSVIWYQGEEDTKYHDLYLELLKTLVTQWRKDLCYDVPFYIVQLPICKDRKHHDWPSLRKAQETFVKNDKHAFLITSLDCGEVDDIHPKEKSVLGKRIGEILNALYYPSAPCMKVESWKSHEIILTCTNATKIKRIDEKTFLTDKPIQSVKVVDHSVYITSAERIHSISYGQENAFRVSLFNEVGYPISPFHFEADNDGIK